MKKSLTLFLSLLFVGMLYSQDNEPAQLSLFQESEEPAPQWILDFVDNDGKSLSNHLSKMFPDVAVSKVDEFVEGNTGVLKDIVFSGQILHEERINEYLNGIKDKLLAENPDLQNQIHVHLKKSASVNAVSYPNGLVLINMGLVAQLESEDELAFVIGHEITHIAEQHSFDGFKDKKTYYKRYRGMSHQDVKDKIDSTFLYSRKQEFEADRNAIGYMKVAGYNPTAAKSLMQKLYFYNVPYYNVPFDHAFLNAPGMEFSEIYFRNKIDSLGTIKESNDRYHSHPGIVSRIENIDSIYTISMVDPLAVHVITESTFFNDLQSFARLKNLKLLLENQCFGRCIYEAYCLLQDDPNSPYINKFVPLSLYGLARYKNADEFRSVAESFNKIPLASQQVHYQLRKMNRMEATLLAYLKMVEYEEEFGEDPILEFLKDDMLDDLIVTIDGEYYVHKKVDGAIDTEEVLYDLLNQKELRDRFKELRSKREDLYGESGSVIDANNATFRRRKKLRRDGLDLEPDRITFLDPYYLCFTQLNTSGIDVERSEKLTKQLYRSFGNECDNENVPYRVLDYDNTIKSKEYLSELKAINKWYNELSSHGVYVPLSLVFEDSNLEAEKYETDIVVKIDIIWAKFLNRSYYKFIAIDLSTGDVVYRNSEVLKNYMSFSMLETYMIKDLAIILK